MIKLTYEQLAQLSVHEQEPEPEPEPEPEAVLPASTTGDQGFTAIAQYDYEVRVLPRMTLLWTTVRSR
jgi:hypothetical protein